MKKFLLTVFLISNFINSQEIINDTLQATTQNLDEVIVKGIRAKFSTPISYSNIDKDDLESKNLGQDLPVLLNFLPSIVTTSDAGAGIGYTGIRIRGVSPQSTNITINGIPFNDPESMGTFWVNLPDFTSSVESLQVQRGIGTSTNGSGAFGASINILTDLISNKPYAELSSSFGSYNTLKNTIKFSTGKINDHFELSGRLSKIDSDGYVDRAYSDLKSYFVQGTYTDRNTLIKVLLFGGHEKTYQSWYGLTMDQVKENRRQNPYTYENEIDNYKQDHYQLHLNEKISNYWSFNLGLNYTYGRGYFEQYKEDDDINTYDGIVTSDLINMVLDKSYNFFNPKIGVSFKVNSKSLIYASFARANREPNRTDFESNSEIKPEKLNDIEIGWRYRTENVLLNLNSYFMLYDEQLILTGEIDDVGNPKRTNSGSSYRIGLEIENSIKLSDLFLLQTNVTFSSNKNKNIFSMVDGLLYNYGKTNISFSPSFIGSNSLSYKYSNNLSFSLISKYVGKQFMGNTDQPNSILKSYFVNDLSISYLLKPNKIFESISVNLLINNLLNKEYISNGYYYTYDDTWSVPGQITTLDGAGYYPQATTNFLTGFIFKF